MNKGSSRCGPCPHGFTGDGYTCVRSDTNSNNQNGITVNGNCVANNICHPMATCNDISNRIVCTCPSGYVGTGIGPLGCTPVNPCASNPCAVLLTHIYKLFKGIIIRIRYFDYRMAAHVPLTDSHISVPVHQPLFPLDVSFPMILVLVILVRMVDHAG